MIDHTRWSDSPRSPSAARHVATPAARSRVRTAKRDSSALTFIATARCGAAALGRPEKPQGDSLVRVDAVVRAGGEVPEKALLRRRQLFEFLPERQGLQCGKSPRRGLRQAAEDVATAQRHRFDRIPRLRGVLALAEVGRRHFREGPALNPIAQYPSERVSVGFGSAGHLVQGFAKFGDLQQDAHHALQIASRFREQIWRPRGGRDLLVLDPLERVDHGLPREPRRVYELERLALDPLGVVVDAEDKPCSAHPL